MQTRWVSEWKRLPASFAERSASIARPVFDSFEPAEILRNVAALALSRNSRFEHTVGAAKGRWLGTVR
jgi:hypothetical protein